MPHLVVSISGHGFGHVAQTAPILNMLHLRCPQLRITVRTSVPLAHLRTRIAAPFSHMVNEGDIGMMMSSALDVRIEDSCNTYRAFHANWDKRIEDEAHLLHGLKADMVFSNVGYLALAGAQRAGVANAALCSLNWADIYRHFCGCDTITDQIHACYANADAFLRTTPGMEMADLPNLFHVAPIASVGEDRREEIIRKLRLSKDEKLVLISLGGIACRLPIEHWPRIDGVRWLVTQDWHARHPDAIVFESLAMSYGDLLASCDALLCKPGYGSFVEAACSSTPVLYVSRSDWPESLPLAEWLRQHGVCREVSRDNANNGAINSLLNELWQTPHPVPIVPKGAEQAAEWIMSKFDL